MPVPLDRDPAGFYIALIFGRQRLKNPEVSLTNNRLDSASALGP